MQWHEIDLLVEALEENHNDMDIEELSTQEVYDLILDLPDFSDDPDAISPSKLNKILETWQEFRRDHA